MKLLSSIAIAALFSSLLAEEAALLELSQGDTWEYVVKVEASAEAPMPKSEGVIVKKTSEGQLASFKKSRTYLGKTRPVAERPEYDTFEMKRAGKSLELEFSDFQKGAIYALGSQSLIQKGSQAILFSDPLLVYSSSKKSGDEWEFSSQVKNEGETPVFVRKFRVFGEEEVVVPAGTFKAVRIVVTGKSGQIDIKRTRWFVAGKGFVKEEKTYYSDNKRLLYQVMELEKFTKGKAP